MKITLVKEKEFYRSVLAIMLPVALQQAINMGVNMLDTMMLGSFGEVQLSASSLANQYYNIFNIFCMGIIGGSSVLAAQYWGAGDKGKVRETFSMAMRLAIGLSVLFAVLTWLFPAQIMRIYTSEEDVIAQGARYLRITTFIFAIHGTSLVAAQLMRSVGQAQLGLRIKHLLKSPSGLFYKNYFRLGAPVLVSDGLLALGDSAVSIVLGHMGAAVVAGNAICMVVQRLFNVVIQGVSNASSIVTGNTIGRGERERAMEQGATFYMLSMIFGAINSVLVFFFGPLTIARYSLEQETVIVTGQLMYAYVVIVFFQAVQSVMTKGVLRGGGDTKFLMKADILFLWLASIPLGALVGLVLHAPAWATMLCLRIDFVIKSAWCVSRLLSGKWIREVSRE